MSPNCDDCRVAPGARRTTWEYSRGRNRRTFRRLVLWTRGFGGGLTGLRGWDQSETVRVANCLPGRRRGVRAGLEGRARTVTQKDPRARKPLQETP